MKKTACIVLLLLTATNALSQAPLSENEKLVSLCKVWGFLKYYHPAVIKGKMDWDKELTARVSEVLSAGNKQQLSGVYSKWINGLGPVKAHKPAKPAANNMGRNADLKWLDDTQLFTDTLTAMLQSIAQSKQNKKNWYAEKSYPKGKISFFKNEEPYADSVYPSATLRLLSLFRYWNIINYFDPYKYMADEDWNKVLKEMIPAFEYPKDTTAYHLAMLELVAKINDSHASYNDAFTRNYFGNKMPPFSCKMIDGEVVVAGFYDDTLAMLNDIQYGDVMLKVNGESINEIIARNSKYIPGSNSAAKNNRIAYYIFSGNTDSCEIAYSRDGIITTKIVRRYPFMIFKPNQQTGPPSKLIADNIGYVNMSLLRPKQVKKTMKPLRHADAIIFDLRGYPHLTFRAVTKFLNPRKTAFAKWTEPDMKQPGNFKFSPTTKCGRKNKKYYKGKVVVLMNELTASQAEYTCMALQTAPNATCIGSQTAGADGDVSVIQFPCGGGTWMSRHGVYYPDGRATQRIGIVPNIVVTPTVAGLRNNKDEVLERALEFARSGK